ncbi:MAG: Ig-like domain-containing protein [Pseudomonadota bacterium]
MIHVAPATVGLAFYLGSDMPWDLALTLPPDMPVRALSGLDAATLSDLMSGRTGEVHLLVPQERRTDLERAKDILEPLLADGSTLKLHLSAADPALSIPAAMVGDTRGGRVQTVLPFEAQSIFSDRAPAAPASAIHTETALIFIDTTLEGWEGIALEAARNGEIILIPAGTDPLAFITDAILAHPGASAVHILSHGADGALRIADTILDAAAIERASGLLAQWGAALAPGADLLLYGCNVAEDAEGLAFIEALAAATGLDVAASTDLTGATGSGGDWALEAQAGSIETRSITVSDLAFANTLAAADIAFDTSTPHDILTTTGADVGRVLLLDIDHDGDQDMIILRDAALGMVDRKYSEVFINDGSGTFTQGQTFGANIRFGEAQIVDVNGDGNLDLVAGVLDGKTQVYTISASGTLTLATSVGFDVANNNDAMTTADIDGDGDPDILVAGAGEVRAYFNTGGTFSAGTTLFSLGTTPGAIDIRVLDLDRDGKADIVVDFDTAGTENFSTVILKGTGTGSFTEAGRLGSVYSGGYFVFDFNRDGFDDFLLYGTALSTNSLFLNNGQIVPTAAAWNSTSWWIAETGYDFDGDGFKDLLSIINSNTTIVSWTEGAGLTSIYSFNIPNLLTDNGYLNQSVAGFADVNGDGKPDAIVQAYIYDWSGSASASKTVWLLNTSADPNAAPVIQVGDANAAAAEQSPVRLAPAVTLTDADGTTLASARIVITNAVAGQDQLSLQAPSGIRNITATFDSATGTLTLTSSGATATLAEWKTALEAVTYINTSNAPDVTTRIITFIVNDGTSDSAAATVNLALTAINDVPVAATDTFTAPEDSTVTLLPLANDSDPEGTLLTISAIDGSAIATGQTVAVTNGSVTLNANGTLTFTPTTNYNGAISFTYTVSDGTLTASAAVSGTIAAVNDAPVAANDSVTTDEDTPLTFAPLSNDSDPDGDTLSITAIIGPNGTSVGTGQTISLSNGTIRLNADGTLTFLPGPDTSGSASFNYRLSDGSVSVIGTATVAVSPVNDAPVAVADAFTTLEDSTITFDPRANDSDAEGAALSIIAIDGSAITVGQSVPVANGSVALNGDGTLTFMPAANFSGSVSFTYTASDGALTSIGSITATVSAVNDAPSAGPDAFTAQEGTPVTFTPLANDSDPEGTALTIIAVEGVAIAPGGTVSLANGTVTLNADGSLTLTPDDGFTGSVSFAYSISDGALTAEGNISGTVEPRLRALDDSFVTAEDVPVLIDVFANDVEQDKNGWRITQVAGAVMAAGLSTRIDSGTVEMTEAGLLRFTPDPDFNGAVAFDYAIANAISGALSTASVRGTVTPMADAPLLVSDSFAPIAGGESVVIDVLANDSDADGDLLRIVGINGTPLAQGQSLAITGGSVRLSTDGQIMLTVAETYDRSITFSYTAEDATGLRATAFVTSSGVLQAVVSDLQRALQESGLVVDDLNDLMYIASVVTPGAFTTLDPALVAKVTGYQAAPGYDLDIDSMSPDSVMLVRALLAIAAAAGAPELLSAQADGSWVSLHDQSLVFQAVSGADRAVQVKADSDIMAYDSQVSSAYAWTKEFAQQMLRPDLSASFVTSYDGHAQAKIHQSEVGSGGAIGMTIAGEAARTPQSDLSNHLGTMDFVSADGTTAVEVSRAVVTAQTVGDMDDQTAIVRMRQNGLQDISVLFYAVDDYVGTIDGVRPGEADYETASRARAYLTPDGQSWISGPGYGAYGEARLADVDSGDLIAMRISSGGRDFYMFAAANEIVDGENVAHAWSYGLNTWGWEDLYGGGDRDFNDLVLQLDFVSAQLGLA